VAGVSIKPCLIAFEGSVADSLQFVRDAQEFMEKGDGSPVVLHIRRREELAALGLLKVQIAWEIFLEEAFTRYMCGASSPAGYCPNLLLGRHRNLEAAQAALLSPNQSYLNWSVRNTLNRATECFSAGEPFATPLAAVTNLLDEVAGIRNRFAHSSQHAVRVFARIVRSRLGYVPRGMTVGRFLLTPMDGLKGSGPPFIDLYGNSLLGAARAIAP
jgi:hypothetical protein